MEAPQSPRTARTAAAAPAAPAQSLPPLEGGSYEVMPDGTLRKREGTAPAAPRLAPAPGV